MAANQVQKLLNPNRRGTSLDHEREQYEKQKV